MTNKKDSLNKKSEEVTPQYELFCGDKKRSCCIANSNCYQEIKVLNGKPVKTGLCCYY